MQLVIPAYNEEHRLPATLRSLRAHVLSATDGVGPVDVIVVDNASTDRTAEVALALDSAAMRVQVLTCTRRGKGAAVRAGIAATTADRVGFMDADGATHLDALVDAAALLDRGVDLAIGSRALEGSFTVERHSRVRAIGATVYRNLTRRVAPGITDTQCGFKVMRGDLAREVMAETRCDGFSFDVELVGRFQRLGAAVEEFPVVWVDVPGSTFVPARHGLASFTELGLIAWRLRTAPAVGTRAPVVPVPLPRQRLVGTWEPTALDDVVEA